MKWIISALIVVAVLLAAFVIWARVAPSDPEVWHVIPETVPRQNVANADLRETEGSLAALDEIIRATARTELLAGSVEQGQVTYITRTALFGFPDYTTVRQDGDRLTIYARARFGMSDLGVNAARVDRWLTLLGQG